MSRTFEIVSCLGRGGFGEVYRARLRREGFVTEVALKLLHAEVDPRGQAAERLRDEARLLGLVRHKGIPRVLDLVELDGRLALVSEYVEGADLSRCLRAPSPPSIRACVEVAAAVADALDAAWCATAADGRPARIVHRDLKPANIRVARDGAVKLLDFGIAWTEEITRAAHTQTEALVGSPAYMAPERFDGARPDPAQDVFSLGAVLFEALAGRKLFDDLAFRAMAALALFEDRYDRELEARLATLPDAAPAEVVLVLRSMLSWSPALRPDAAEVAARLEALAPSCPGASLGAWCRAHAWGDEPRRQGPWVGRTLSDGAAPGPDVVETEVMGWVVPEPLTEELPAPPRRGRWLVPAIVAASVALGAGAWIGLDGRTPPAAVAAPPATIEPTVLAASAPVVAAPATVVAPPAPTPTTEAPAPTRRRGTTTPSKAAPVRLDANDYLGDEPEPAPPSPPVVARVVESAPTPVRPVELAPAKPAGPRVELDPASGPLTVRLSRAGQLYDLPAVVPPGSYQVLVDESAGNPRPWGTVAVPDTDRVRIRCAMKLCRT